jgi:uncharacterized membrane protein
MDDITLARALHVLAVVHWIGGVAMVTMVLLPAMSSLAEPERRLAMFEAIEGRFGAQARWSVAVAGLSGFWMTWRLDAWARYVEPRSWWMLAMLLLWAVFAVILYVAEPLFLHAWVRRQAQRDPLGTMAKVLAAHRVLLAVAAVTVAAAVMGAHGMLY